MKTRRWHAILVCSVFPALFTLSMIGAGGATRTPRNRPAAQAETAGLRPFVEGWAAAIQSGNLDRIMAHYAQNDTLTIFNDLDSPRAFHKWSEWRQQWQDFLAHSAAIDRWELSDIQTRASGVLGYCTATWHGKWTREGNLQEMAQGHLTLVLLKSGGKWRILHEHLSAQRGPTVGVGVGPGGEPGPALTPPPPQYALPNLRGDGKSGIGGVAMAGPVKGGPVRPGDPDALPLPNAVLVVEAANGGQEIARQRADVQGRFRIALAPGTYRLRPLPPRAGARLPRGEVQTVTVAANRFAQVRIDYDTGLR